MKRKDTSSSSKEPHDESAWKRLNYVPGGARQKTKWASEIANKGAKPSALAEFLISQWSWGHISTPFMQKVAEAAAADGLQHPEIERLSSLGSHGRHPNNAHRDLMTHLVKPPIHEAIGNITLLQKYNLSFVSTSQSILLPHELFASMYANHRDKFFITVWWIARQHWCLLVKHVQTSILYRFNIVDEKRPQGARHTIGNPWRRCRRQWYRQVLVQKYGHVFLVQPTLQGTNFNVELPNFHDVSKVADEGRQHRWLSQVLAKTAMVTLLAMCWQVANPRRAWREDRRWTTW